PRRRASGGDGMGKDRPTLLLTLGDVAGIGPEIVVRAWSDPTLHTICRPVLIGDEGSLRLAIAHFGSTIHLEIVDRVADARPDAERMGCVQGTSQDLARVPVGRITAAGGRAAYDFLCHAIDLTVAGEADGIVTLPLHKEGLHLAGIPHPGHTEILAERTRTPR